MARDENQRRLNLNRLMNAVNEAEDEVEDQESPLRAFARAKKQEKTAKDTLSDLKPLVIAHLDDEGQKSKTIPFDKEEDVTIQIKERDNSKIDPDLLRKQIGAKAFNKLTSPELDEEKVNAAIAMGELDAKVVAGCMVDTTPTRYPDVRFKKAKR